MRKLLNNPWIVTALAVMAVAFVWISVRPAAPVVVPQETEIAETFAPGEVPGEETIAEDGAPASVEEALKAVAVTGMLRDPFAGRPKVALIALSSEPVVPDIVDTIKLSAIWTQEGRTYVLINGRIHQAGDEISKITIESATQDGVWLAHWKGRDFISVGADFTLVTPDRSAMRAASL
jgi:hypothetical protein